MSFRPDEYGDVQPHLLGDIKDLQRIEVGEVAGMPIEQVQNLWRQEMEKQGKPGAAEFPNYIMGFPNDKTIEVPIPGKSLKLVWVTSLGILHECTRIMSSLACQQHFFT